MDPNVWGQHAWIFLHSITLNYPSCPTEKDKENMKNFFLSLKNVLPCSKCRNNFENHLKKFPLTDKVLCSKEDLVKWLINIHNSVNEQTGKKIMRYNEVLQFYSNLYHKDYNIYIYIIIFLIFIIICLLTLFFLRKKILKILTKKD